MKCLVTGGAGFIGSNLVKSLLERGHSVRVLDNFSTGKLENLGPVRDHIELVEGDLRSYHIVREAVRDREIIFHQGALPSVPRSIKDPITTNQVNVEGTLNVLNAARIAGTRRVVFASSASTYGNNPTMPLHENMCPQPISPYGVSKLTAEQYCHAFTKVYDLETVCLRYFNVFGPGQDGNAQYTGAIAIFATALLSGKPVYVDGDGEQSKDFTYVDNVVQANLLAAESPNASGETFNIACGTTTSINTVLEHIQTFAEIRGEVIHRETRPGDIRHSQANIEKARLVLGYNPIAPVSLGLRLSVEWYRAFRKP